MEAFGDCMVQGHSRWRVRVYPEALSHKLLNTMEVIVDQEDVQEEVITLEGVNGKYIRKVRKEPNGHIETAVECSETYETCFRADPSNGHRTHSVSDDPEGEKAMQKGIAKAIDNENCCEKVGNIPDLKAYQIENEKILFVEEAQAKNYDQVYCWNEDGILMCVSDDSDTSVSGKTKKYQAKKHQRRDQKSERNPALRIDFEGDSDDGGLLAGENITPGTVIWEFYPKLLPEFNEKSSDEEIPEIIIEYPSDTESKASESNDNQNTDGGDKEQNGDSEENGNLKEGALTCSESDRNNNSETAGDQNGSHSRDDSDLSSPSAGHSGAVHKMGKHFKWELSLGVQKPYLKSMFKEPVSNGILLHTLTSSYQSQCLPNTYIVLNNDLRFLRYAKEGNVTLQQSEISHEEGSMVIDQIVAIKDIKIGEEVLRDFKTIIEELESGFMPFSP